MNFRGIYKGLLTEVAQEFNVSRSYINACIKSQKSEKELEIFRRVIEKMEERKAKLDEGQELKRRFEKLK